MRKIVAVILTLMMVFAMGIPATAESVTNAPTELPDGVYYLEDGSYFVTETFVSDAQTRAVSAETYSRVTTYYDKNDVAQCALEVIGTFEINYGVSVTCTDVAGKGYIYVDGWSVENVSKSSSSGSTATATVSGEFVKKVLFITTARIPVTVSINVDKYGNTY